MIGVDYSEECRQGSMGIAELEEILDDPAAAMEENAIRLRQKVGKGKAVEIAPQNRTNYSNVSPNFWRCVLTVLTQSLTIDKYWI